MGAVIAVFPVSIAFLSTLKQYLRQIEEKF
jgi:hypothetical protein